MTEAAQTVTPAESGLDDPEVEASAADRVVVFSDAVVAIAITLLALALPVPDSTAHTTNVQFLHSLRADWNQYSSFLLSFVIIGGNWSAHRRTFRYVNRLNTAVSTLNMIWLLMMILTPFAARLLPAPGGAFAVRFTIYTLVQVIAAACLLQMSRRISRDNLLRPNAPAAARNPDNSHYLALVVAFLLSIAVAFVAPSPWPFVLWVSVPAVSPVMRRRLMGGRHAARNGGRATG